MKKYRSHTCGALGLSDCGQFVRLSGWVHRKRDHGNLLFIDLRDHYGITQCVLDSSSVSFESANTVRLESVVSIYGEVLKRPSDTVNSKLATGDIEVQISEFEVLSSSDSLPLQVNASLEVPEEIRLRYRFLDLRREKLHQNIVLRSNVISFLRQRMLASGFMEFQTPILTASSPEGARDYLVPSRLHPGRFYALPQAPQLFKQMLMVSGFDRYFQIAPCFRDEDGRADRSPTEFYQLDFEMSFVTQEDIFAAIEPVIHDLFVKFGQGRAVTEMPFPRISYNDAMLKYGTDKPDLRISIEISDVTSVFKGSEFRAFADAIENGGVVRAIPVPDADGVSRSFFDKLNEWAKTEGAPGLGYIVFGSDFSAKGPIAKFINGDRLSLLKSVANVGSGDAVFFVCGKSSWAAKFSGQVRKKIAEELGLIDRASFNFCWVVDFPMYEIDESTGKIDFSHNPFSMPQGGLASLLSQDPLTIKAYQFDIVCNGYELSSGAVRNHKPEILFKAFEIAGHDREYVERRFGGLVTAFKFGAPPHGGAAPGIDRIVMLLADEPNLREIVAFPTTQRAEDLLMNAPSSVDAERLKEVHIRLDLPKKKGSSQTLAKAMPPRN